MSFHYYLTPIGRSDPGAEPMIPLPYPGEGGPVYPGDDPAAEPVIPLPYPGEGGPVYPGDDPAAEPVIPLPYPGEGGPVYPGNSGWVQPGASRVRFLNAAYSYPPLRIDLSNGRFVNRLGYTSITGYGRVRAGYQTVTVSGSANGRIYLQRSLPFQAGGIMTVAVIRTAGGLDLLPVADTCCRPSNGWANFRVGNLAFNSSPLDVLMSDGRVVFGDLRYKEVASNRRIQPGSYRFFYADTDMSPMASSLSIESLDPAWLDIHPPLETFGSVYLNISPGENCTVYLLQSGNGRNNIQNMILTDG